MNVQAIMDDMRTDPDGYGFAIFPANDTYGDPCLPILALGMEVSPRVADTLHRFYLNMGDDGLAIEESISNARRAARAVMWFSERHPDVRVAMRDDVQGYFGMLWHIGV